MKRFRSLFIVLIAALTGFSSCSRSLGYSVLLWDLPEKNIQDGAIVKVLLKSNISRVYIVQSLETKEKVEVPLWQITEPSSKRKAVKKAQEYAEYQHQYGRIKVDGLPVRKEPVNTAKQVYRLHQDEIVKLLYKGEGQDVMVGRNQKLEGDWLCVLTEGGTQGWCFSYNLTMFTTGEGGEVTGGEVKQEESTNEDTMMEQILNAKWYPESYIKQVKDGMIDLETMKVSYGFDTGITSGKVTVNVPDKFHTAKYNGAEKLRSGVYALTDTPFQIIVRNPNFIVVNYTRGDTQEAYNFVTMPEDQNFIKIIEKERGRRAGLISKLYNVASFNSENYGSLVINKGQTFTWTNFGLLVPSVIPEGAAGRGKVSMKYLIDKSLQGRYDGCLTFVFDGSKKEVNFLYKLGDGLNMESIDALCITDNIVKSRSTSPTVMYFSK
ncbi:MAG: SH3 domain-containing protein [Treponema sp.]|nr:SH3 domain-containing protein [Treponema sp.]